MERMNSYTSASGATFTDADLERWASEAEAGFPGATFGSPTPGRPTSGRPVTVGQDARPLTIRLDAARRAKLAAHAAEQHTTVSRVLRNLIDAL